MTLSKIYKQKYVRKVDEIKNPVEGLDDKIPLRLSEMKVPNK